jgi:hypothetical protein
MADRAVLAYLAKYLCLYPALFSFLGAVGGVWVASQQGRPTLVAWLGTVGFVVFFAMIEVLILCNWRVVQNTVRNIRERNSGG